jgi:uncharacterized phage protein (TIGR01671 family)
MRTLQLCNSLAYKKGKEIYEGDIVICKEATDPEDKGFVCLFKDFRWKFFNVRYPDNKHYSHDNYDYVYNHCEVIGNIYETPELLK